MKNFNMTRFLRTLRWYVGENKKSLTSWSVGFALGYMLLQSMLVWLTKGRLSDVVALADKVSAYQVSVISITSVCYVCMVVAVLVACSSIFNTLKAKQKRLDFFMLPATNLERFLAALIFSVVIIPFCIELAAIVGDSLRAFFFMLMGEQWVSGIIRLQFLTDNGNFSFKDMMFNDTSDNILFAWICSIFVLGGTWLRKHSFAAVGLCMVALATVFAWSLKTFVPMIHLNDGMVAFINSYGDIIGFVLVIGLTVLNYWLSYRLFKRFQIVSPKWTNV